MTLRKPKPPRGSANSLRIVEEFTADELDPLFTIEDTGIERSLLRTMINIVPDYLFVKDAGSRFVLANTVVAADIGREVKDLLGKTDFDLHPTEMAAKFFADEQRIMHTGTPEIDIEEFVVTVSGAKKWLSTSKLPLRNADGRVVGIVGVCRDVTARKQAEEALAESESRWNFALEGAGQGVWDHDLRRGTAFYSSMWRRMRGFGLDEKVDSSREAWLARVHPDDRARLMDQADRQNSGEIAQNSFEYRERHRGGHYIWILSRGKPIEWNTDGSVARIIGTDTDITKIKEEEARAARKAAETYRRHLTALEKAQEATEAARQQAQALARHDALTGLPNRRVFSESLDTAIARSSRSGAQFAILLIDLDRFKQINDIHGHAAGDAVLTEVAIRLAGLARKGDTTARLGGDEFAAIVHCSDAHDSARVAAAFAERVAASISRPISFNGLTMTVGSSIGIAICPTDGPDPDMLLRAADMAMYRAKEQGRGSYRFFQPTMETMLRERVALEEDVRRAVAEQRIVPQYQPLIQLAEEKLVGFEILARWSHPERGEVDPDIFIPIVEKLGLIGELTYAMLRRACFEARDWPQHLTLSINVSPSHVCDPLLPVKLLAILSEAGFPPSRLEVEITETALVTDLAAARSALTALQGLGMKISLDDFGIEYSSLYNLGNCNLTRSRSTDPLSFPCYRMAAAQKLSIR